MCTHKTKMCTHTNTHHPEHHTFLHSCLCVPPTPQVKVTTVDGPVELKIPAGTQPGTTLLMAKRGVPRLGNAVARGDHQVRFSLLCVGVHTHVLPLLITAAVVCMCV